MKKLSLILCFLFVTLMLQSKTKTMYVRAFKAPVKDHPQGKIVSKLKRGDEIKVLFFQGFYAVIGHNNSNKYKVGYISKLFLSNKKPSLKPIRFKNLRNLNVMARRRASTETTAASARGAADENAMISLRNGQLKNTKIDMVPVETMEALNINDEDVLKFVMGLK